MYGGKWVLFMGVIGWSVFTILVPPSLSVGFWALILCRILLGAAEGVGFPAVHSLLGKWIPPAERSRAVSIVTAFSYLGTILSSVIASALLDPFGWRSVFYSFGSLGLVWTWPWLYYGANEPRVGYRGLSEDEFECISSTEPPQEENAHFYASTKADGISVHSSEDGGDNDTGDAEDLFDGAFDYSRKSPKDDSYMIKPTPWGRILRAKEVWAIIINQFCQSWGFYTMLMYMPQYFKEVYHLDSKEAGFLTIMPNMVQGLGGIAMGFIGDYFIKQGLSTGRLRMGAQTIGMMGPALFFALLGYIGDSSLIGAEFLATTALGLNTATLIGVSCSQLDIAPKYAGTVFALGNVASTIAGMTGSLVAGQILNVSKSWSLVFTLCSGLNIVGAISWWFMGGGDKIVID